MNLPFEVSSFYRFSVVTEQHIPDIKQELELQARERKLGGLVIIASEGVNGTVAGEKEQIDFFQNEVQKIFGGNDWNFKRSRCYDTPFKNFRIKIRPEIVTTRSPMHVLVEGKTKKLSPAEWHMMLKERDDFVLLDTRNKYETDLGVFRGALDPKLKNFQEFEDFVSQSDIAKNKKVLMYCTGGIRCEKAAVIMERAGYNNVYQLDGGILRYLEVFPNEYFEGECFVFDNRVALNQNLEPTDIWAFCPHCGDPGKEEISCDFCKQMAKVCLTCLQDPSHRTCSKDCAYRHAHQPQHRKKEQ